jgi:hypothetical protein
MSRTHTLCYQAQALTSSNTMVPDWPQLVCSATSVIAQQYSSTTFVSLHFHSHQEKFRTLFKNVILSICFYFLKNCTSLKLCNVKLHLTAVS